MLLLFLCREEARDMFYHAYRAYMVSSWFPYHDGLSQNVAVFRYYQRLVCKAWNVPCFVL